MILDWFRKKKRKVKLRRNRNSLADKRVIRKDSKERR